MARKTQTELKQDIVDAQTEVEVGAIYKHYKNGDEYKVTDLAINEATAEVTVIYEAQYGNKLHFTRALSSWVEMVEKDGERTPRFRKEA